jgi:kynureninase
LTPPTTGNGGVDELLRWRTEFPILENTVYLISNSLGAMPRGAAQGLQRYAEIWAARGIRAWEEHWWELAGAVGNRVARIIGAPTGSVSMHENVTSASAIALSCFQPHPGKDKLVCLANDFPSVLYLYQAQQSYGWRVHRVPGEADLSVREERVLNAIDSQTMVVALSHVLFRNSYIMDVAPIVRRAHEVGAVVILDTYQSAGIIPVDVAALDVDFAVGGCLKWLCGGPGNAFLYTRPDLLARVRPRLTGWFAHRAPFEFDTGAMEPRDDAMKMMSGTPSIPAYYAAMAGLDIVAAVGVDGIRAKSKQMTGRLLELVDDKAWSCAATRDLDRVAGTVAIAVPDAKHVARALKARDFLIDYRVGAGIRVSPHFYNSTEELERLVAEMDRILRDHDYDTTAPPVSLVT